MIHRDYPDSTPRGEIHDWDSSERSRVALNVDRAGGEEVEVASHAGHGVTSGMRRMRRASAVPEVVES